MRAVNDKLLYCSIDKNTQGKIITTGQLQTQDSVKS